MQLWLAPRDICALVATVQARDDLRRYIATTGGFAGSLLQGIAALRGVYKRHFSDCVAAQSPEELDLHRLVTIPRAAYHVLRHLGFCVFYDEDGNRRTLRDEAGRPVCVGVEVTRHPLMKSPQVHHTPSSHSVSSGQAHPPPSSTQTTSIHRGGPPASQVPNLRFNPLTYRVGPAEASIPTSRSGGALAETPVPVSGRARNTGLDAYGRPLPPMSGSAEDQMQGLRRDMEEVMQKLSQKRQALRSMKEHITYLSTDIRKKEAEIAHNRELQEEHTRLRQSIQALEAESTRLEQECRDRLNRLQENHVRMAQELRAKESQVLSQEDLRAEGGLIGDRRANLKAHEAMEQHLRGEISTLEAQQKRAVTDYEQYRERLERAKKQKGSRSWRMTSRIGF